MEENNLENDESMVFVSRSNCMEMIAEQFPDFKNRDHLTFEEGMSNFANYYGNKIILAITQMPPSNIMAEVGAYMNYLLMHGDQDVQEVIQTRFFEHELTIESETKEIIDSVIEAGNNDTPQIFVTRSNCMEIISTQFPDFKNLDHLTFEQGMTNFANYYTDKAIKLFCQNPQSTFLNEVKDFMNDLLINADQDVKEVVKSYFVEHDVDLESKIKEHIKLALES